MPEPPPLGLYIHLPWCLRKCPYCDFTSFEASEPIPERPYVDALLRDLSYAAPAIEGRAVATIFIGGGTPSLFSGDAIGALLAGVRDRITSTDAAEITLEVNPGAADRARFAAYRAAGVNRLSIGIQSFRDAALRRLGRVHDAEDARRAVTAARNAGFTNLNIDLMYGLPGDEPGDALGDLAAGVALGTEHVSWYQLTIESATAFGRCPPPLPEPDRVAAEHDLGRAYLGRAGLAQYEVSAYARNGAESRHNLNYWRFGDYLGIGAGAHGKLTLDGGVYRTIRRSRPAVYLASAGSKDAVAEIRRLSDRELGSEFMLNTLRLKHGFEPSLFERRTGLALSALHEPLDLARSRGWLARTASRIAPTENGFRFLNDLQMLFV